MNVLDLASECVCVICERLVTIFFLVFYSLCPPQLHLEKQDERDEGEHKKKFDMVGANTKFRYNKP